MARGREPGTGPARLSKNSAEVRLVSRQPVGRSCAVTCHVPQPEPTMTLATDIEPQDAPERPLAPPGAKPPTEDDRTPIGRERLSGGFRPTTNRTARFAGVAAAERSQR